MIVHMRAKKSGKPMFYGNHRGMAVRRQGPRLLLLLAVYQLAACTYIIPEDASVPRYNEVLGERHKPIHNNPTTPAASPEAVAAEPWAPEQVSTAVTPVTVATLPPPSMPALPPVDPAVRAQAAAQMSANGRHVPLENASLEVADSSLTDVPPRPAFTGDDSAKAHLDATRHDLESERPKAAAAKAQLDKDAADEPSMLPPPLPTGPGAPAMPNSPTPMPNNASPQGMNSFPVPPPSSSPQDRIAVNNVAPPTLQPIHLTPPPAQPPIHLTPPPGMDAYTALPPLPTSTPASAQVASSSDFNPFSSAPSATPLLSDADELPPSRYAFKR